MDPKSVTLPKSETREFDRFTSTLYCPSLIYTGIMLIGLFVILVLHLTGQIDLDDPSSALRRVNDFALFVFVPPLLAGILYAGVSCWYMGQMKVAMNKDPTLKKHLSTDWTSSLSSEPSRGERTPRSKFKSRSPKAGSPGSTTTGVRFKKRSPGTPRGTRRESIPLQPKESPAVKQEFRSFSDTVAQGKVFKLRTPKMSPGRHERKAGEKYSQKRTSSPKFASLNSPKTKPRKMSQTKGTPTTHSISPSPKHVKPGSPPRSAPNNMININTTYPSSADRSNTANKAQSSDHLAKRLKITTDPHFEAETRRLSASSASGTSTSVGAHTSLCLSGVSSRCQ